jgi:hypothetical protein
MEDFGCQVTACVLLVLICWGGYSAYNWAHDQWSPQISAAGEYEGTVKSDDCRQQIMLSEDSPVTRQKKFMCIYQKSKTGKLMSGICTAVEMDGSTCKAAYTYQKKPWRTCPEGYRLTENDVCLGCPPGTHEMGDLCYLNPGFHWTGPDRKAAEADKPKPMECQAGTHPEDGACHLNPHFHWEMDRQMAVPDPGFHWGTDFKTAEPDKPEGQQP